MKRRILEAFLLMAVLSAAASAQAATITSTTSIGSLGFSPGNKVTVTAFSTAGVATAPGSYAATSIHSSGSRTYGVNSGTTMIYFKDNITGNDAAASTTTFGTGWTSM